MTTGFSAPRLALVLTLILCPGQTRVSAAQDKLNAGFPDPVVAQGKGFEIRRSLLDDFVINYKTDLAARKRAIPPSEMPGIASNILQHLILNKILVQKATDEEKTRVKAAVAKSIENYRKSEPEYLMQAELKASGETLEVITARTVEEQLGKAVLVRELVPSNDVSDEAIQKYYDANPDKFVMPEQARIAQILLATQDQDTHQPLTPAQTRAKEKLAEEIKAKADRGEDFAALAKQYSDDSASKDKGGEYPPFFRGKMEPQFRAIEIAAFTLDVKTNQVSSPVETMYGYHIIKLLEKIPSSKIELAKVSADIKDRLIDADVNKQLPAYAEKLKAEYEVKIFEQDPDASLDRVPAHSR